jgi:hypothetical protein
VTQEHRYCDADRVLRSVTTSSWRVAPMTMRRLRCQRVSVCGRTDIDTRRGKTSIGQSFPRTAAARQCSVAPRLASTASVNCVSCCARYAHFVVVVYATWTLTGARMQFGFDRFEAYSSLSRDPFEVGSPRLYLLAVKQGIARSLSPAGPGDRSPMRRDSAAS